MKIKVPEAELLRTPIKIEKLSLPAGARAVVITVGVIATPFQKTMKLKIHYKFIPSPVP